LLKAVLFDMDGVIADTEPLHFFAYQALLEDYGESAPDSEWVEHIGLSEEDIWQKARNEHRVIVPKEMFEQARREMFFKELEDIQPTDSLMELLDDLKKSKIKIGLVSSSGKEVVMKVLKKLLIEGYFDVIVTGDDVASKKPDKEPYALALSKLSFKGAECLAIEDSVHGIRSAKAAGIRCIALHMHLPKESLQAADMIVDSLSELTYEGLKRINKDD
jgi:beta-phosphoglucomutase